MFSRYNRNLPENVMRPSIEKYFLSMSKLVATRSTCMRRNVGCVVTDEMNFVISTGYNGIVSGQPHCVDSPCLGVNSGSSEDLEQCMAVHAEQNAILTCDSRKIHTIYTTVSPCITCAKLICNTSCSKVVYLEEYSDTKGLDLLAKSGITCIKGENNEK